MSKNKSEQNASQNVFLGSRWKSWSNHLREFLMLFLAVLGGFFAENQRERMSERSREKQYMINLLDDLAVDTFNLRLSITDLQENVIRMDSLKFLLASEEIRNEGSRVYYLGRRASRGGVLSLNDRSFQQMKNSDAFRLIRKDDVVRAIMNYYNLTAFIDMLKDVEMSEAEAYRSMAAEIFDPILFDGQVSIQNAVVPLAGNPKLRTYDREVLLTLAGFVSYLKNTRLAKAQFESEMAKSAVQLMQLIAGEYGINEENFSH